MRVLNEDWAQTLLSLCAADYCPSASVLSVATAADALALEVELWQGMPV